MFNQKNLKISQEIFKIINQSKNILFCLHPSPDEDSLGSNLAMYSWLKSIGKNPTVIKGDSELKNRPTIFADYSSIELKNIFEINIADYDLFISMDAASYSQISKLGDTESLLKNFPTIVIDHHPHNNIVTPYKLNIPQSSATCELVFDLFKQWKIEITENIAICLYFGIFSDTSGLINSNTTPKVFSKCGQLIKKITNLYELTSIYSFHRQPEEFIFTKLALDKTKTYFSGQVAISSVSLKDLEKNNLKTSQASKNSISEFLRTCINWQITVSLVETEIGKCEVSLRSHGPQFDVSQIARNLGGGGHVVASGITIFSDSKTATNKIIEQIATVCPDLGKP